MSEKRSIYVDRIISEIKSLENDLMTAKRNEALPFSFFKESFVKTQNISRMLHELEFMQVDEMKNQMERLVKFLSESEVKADPVSEPETGPVPEPEAEPAPEPEYYHVPEPEADPVPESEEQVERTPEVEVREPQFTGNIYAKGIELPEYQKNQHYQAPKMPQATPVAREVLMDEIKRGISLNDRFLFQRELFNNSRAEMDATLERLNSFESYEQAEDHLKESKTWNFEDSTVGDFLLVIKNRFK